MSKELAKKHWFDGSSSPVNFCDIIEDIKEYSDFELFVGCDSHKISEKYVFATVIALHKPGKGGHFFFYRKKAKDNRFDNIKVRLLEETESAINVARLVKEHFPSRSVAVHLDINADPRYRSSVVLQPATAYVISSGFQVAIKPLSWASSSLADAFAK
jgi:predicted RNase H-related nuclease YkuK (DUF458 family)